MNKIEFLKYVYDKQCSPGQYFVLSAKKGNRWIDHPVLYNPKTINKDLRQYFRLYPESDWDLYFSVASYKGRSRTKANATETKFLSQDIDENYVPTDELKPSLLWESSPGKFQGLWELDRYISVPTFDEYNKTLAKKIGADDCYDLTHVFRIPGTLNHKYKNKPRVSKASHDKPMKLYRQSLIKNILNIKNSSKSSKKSNKRQLDTSHNVSERAIYAKYDIPQDIKNYLASPSLQDDWDRSRIIWYIENKLNEIGMEPQEIITLIKHSVFNKYKGREDEDRRLKNELMKILKDDTVDEDLEPLNFTSYQGVMGSLRTFEGWMVKGIWGRKSHGIVAGMPKTFKSTLVQDLAVSVASGKPFLNKFEVLESGPVIIIQNENADYIMKDRTEKMIYNKGLVGNVEITGETTLKVQWAPDLPIAFVNQEGFTLSDEKKKKQLELLIKQVKPVLVIFDPLYLMFNGDINKAEDLNPALNWLLSLKNNYNTSIMLLHHYNKGSGGEEKGGARMSGSIFLYGWIESAWYLTKEDGDFTADEDEEEEDFKPSEANVQLRREFRMAGQYPDLDITLTMGEIGDPRYEVVAEKARESKAPQKKEGLVVKDKIVKVLQYMEGYPDRLWSRKEISECVNLSRKQTMSVLDKLLGERIEKIGTNQYKLIGGQKE